MGDSAESSGEEGGVRKPLIEPERDVEDDFPGRKVKAMGEKTCGILWWTVLAVNT